MGGWVGEVRGSGARSNNKNSSAFVFRRRGRSARWTGRERGCDVRSTTGVKVRREGEREKERDGRTAGRKGEDEGWLGGRWSRVRNETILSSRGREGRCERVGVVFSPLRRLTSLRRGNGGGESGADVGRAPSRWGPNVASPRATRGRGGGRGPVKLTKMTRHLLSVSLSLSSRIPLCFVFSPISATMRRRRRRRR